VNRAPVSESVANVALGCPFVAVLSGKGGVGKTNLVANLAVASAGLCQRVLVVDGDLGLANVDVLLGLVTPFTVEDVLLGRCRLEEALVEGPRGLRLLPAAAGRSDLAALHPDPVRRLMALLREAARDFDLVLVDAGAGIGPSVVGLASSCDRALLVTTPEPTSLADAYAALKLLARASAGSLPVDLVVNEVRDEFQARATHARLERLAHRFLDASIGFRAFLPSDPRLADAVACQRAVVELFPAAPSSRRLVALARGLLRESAHGGGGASSSQHTISEGSESCTRN